MQYLSPIEFETLIFLIFNNQKWSFCSSFRGGTLPGFDFRVKIYKKVYGLSKGIYLVQVKKKSESDITLKPKTILVHIGKTDEPKRIFGSDWISDRVSERPDISAWLRKMTFNYPTIFDLGSFFKG